MPLESAARAADEGKKSEWASFAEAKRDSTSSRSGLSPEHASSKKAGRCSGASSRASCKTSFTRCQRSGLISPAPANLTAQPHPRRRPVPLHRCRGRLQHGRRLFVRQPAEESQFHNPALPWIEAAQIVEGVVKRNQIYTPDSE